jgi:hypothetical protein
MLMGRVMKKVFVGVSVFALVLMGMFSGLKLMAWADAPTTYSTRFSIVIAEGTNPPSNYNVSWSLYARGSEAGQLGDYLGVNGVSSNGEGTEFSITTGTNCGDHIINGTEILVVQVQGAGLGVKLGDEDVTADYEAGVQIPLSELANSYTFTLYNPHAGGDQGGGQEGGNQSEEHHDIDFSGNVWFAWAGASDALCICKITNLQTLDSENHPIMNSIPVTDVKDIDTGEQLTIQNEKHYWLWESSQDFIFTDDSLTERAFASFTEFEAALTENEDVLRTYAIDPCGAIDGESTICTNGDRVFRATIYDSTDYQGMQFSINPDDYTYFPGWWEPIFFSNEVDLTGTTKDSPALYESFLLEPSAHFGSTDRSLSTITSVEPLDVPANAVSVTKNSDGTFDVVFNSNFYVAVEFKVTTTEDTYYVTIQRTCFRAHDTKGPNVTNPKVVAEFYYDGNETYSEYDVVATKYYSDGSTKLAILSPENTDSFGGTNLKCTSYVTDLDENLVGVAYMAVKAGTLDGTSFKGIQAGADTGYYFDISKRMIVY